MSIFDDLGGFAVKLGKGLVQQVVGNIFGSEQPTEEDKANIAKAEAVVIAQIQAELEEKRLGIEEIKVFISESLAMINSSDKFTSRARPMGVYAATLITTMLAIGLMFEIKIDTVAILTLLAPLWGNAAYYTKSRSDEKRATMNGVK